MNTELTAPLPAADALIWVDTETTGLDTSFSRLLEIAVAITDLNGEVLDTFERVIHPKGAASMGQLIEHLRTSDDPGDQAVFKMHTASGLWEEVLNSEETYRSVDDDLMVFLFHTEVPLDDLGRAPMCGNTVNFDQRMCAGRLPQFSSQFSHRTIDMSSTKELVKRRWPKVAAEWQQICDDKGSKPHRAMDDILWSIEEYKFYLNAGMIC